MEDNPYNSTDLDSVLKTLSTLAPQSNSSISSPIGTSRTTSTAGQRTRIPTSARPAPPPPKPATTPTVDPSTITTWSAALRYVMRTVNQDEETQLRIRGLIRSQHSHERQWWKGREALVQRQQARGDKKKELDAVLYVRPFPLGSPVYPSTDLESTLAPQFVSPSSRNTPGYIFPSPTTSNLPLIKWV